MEDDIRQIILGSLLGNGYICKGRTNDYLCIRHSTKYSHWLRVKGRELSQFASDKPISIKNTTITWRSKSHSFFSELRKFCYPNNKKTVTMDWLDQLRDLAIAVWFGDSGILVGRDKKNACLRTQAFGKEGNDLICRFFNEVGFPCKVNKSKKSYVILFSVRGSRDLLLMIANALPMPLDNKKNKQ